MMEHSRQGESLRVTQSTDMESINADNVEYWNHVCGSPAAKVLGVVNDKPQSLKKYDDWYFSFYPYLFLHIPFEELRDRDVLEVGLGYGTVSQRIAESGARYVGLDIAPGPVDMVNHRLRQAELGGVAQLGSILQAPFDSGTFDFVVAIGALHHTGNLQAAIDECWRVLRPGGKLIFMVYYAYSYRRFFEARDSTLRHWFRELVGYRGVVGSGGAKQRALYDANTAGDTAPHTDFASRRSLRHMCRKFAAFSATCENLIHTEAPFNKGKVVRRDLLKTWYPRLVGLDIYVTATK